ncbi:hypothetical protein [Burkholderia pseudomallei]|uniref:hypothetical protein n=1 Tax=Burkholderia pseudomallei TaxID=28450 RepID=UPI0005385D46|nr:hypothetical protein [Burkholderia pseudomallei]KGW11292.1 hypothetical protein X980_2658 [Burkholderia pseudomallei MSHR4000]
MAKHPDDDRTIELFPGGLGHAQSFTAVAAGKTVSEAARRFAARRKVFPQMTVHVECEICGRKHRGDCEDGR